MVSTVPPTKYVFYTIVNAVNCSATKAKVMVPYDTKLSLLPGMIFT